MLKLGTDCTKCVHQNVCRYKHNARNDMDKLLHIDYGKGPNDDYDWGTMSKRRHVDITFSCPDYKYDGGLV